MLQTILTGKYISIQGEYVRDYPDGQVMVKVGPTFHIGRPVSTRQTGPGLVEDDRAAV